MVALCVMWFITLTGWKQGSCELFEDDDTSQHTLGREGNVIKRSAQSEASCEAILAKLRLDGLSTAAERDLQTSSTSFTEAGVLSTSTELDLQTSSTKFAESTSAGPALTTIPAYELLGWEYYYETNMCYKKFRVAGGGNQDVKESEKNCTGYGGNLASIHSKAQNNFLQQMLPITPCAIGLRFVENQCGVSQPYWSDSSVVNFQNWKPGEPNNYGCVEFCTYLQSDGTWNNYKCDAIKTFVCETDNIVYCPQRGT